MKKYSFKYIGQDTYEVYECGSLLLRFKRSALRGALESLERGSNWVGSVVRFFNKSFPLERIYLFKKSPEDYPLPVLVNYLRMKGYLVWRTFEEFEDSEIIDYLSEKGFKVKGLQSACTRSPTLLE